MCCCRGRLTIEAVGQPSLISTWSWAMRVMERQPYMTTEMTARVSRKIGRRSKGAAGVTPRCCDVQTLKRAGWGKTGEEGAGELRRGVRGKESMASRHAVTQRQRTNHTREKESKRRGMIFPNAVKAKK